MSVLSGKGANVGDLMPCYLPVRQVVRIDLHSWLRCLLNFGIFRFQISTFCVLLQISMTLKSLCLTSTVVQYKQVISYVFYLVPTEWYRKCIVARNTNLQTWTFRPIFNMYVKNNFKYSSIISMSVGSLQYTMVCWWKWSFASVHSVHTVLNRDFTLLLQLPIAAHYQVGRQTMSRMCILSVRVRVRVRVRVVYFQQGVEE